MARKFFVDDNNIIKVEDNIFKITGEETNHIKVLRHNLNDIIIINNSNYEIVKITKEYILIKYISCIDDDVSRNIDVTLFQSFLKGDKMDFVITKATELGVKKIVPFLSRNSVVKLDKEIDKAKKLNKFNKTSIEAIKQCGRTDNVVINEIVKFDDIIDMVSNYDLCIFAYEKEKENIKDVISRIKLRKNIIGSIAVVIGPEGGFDETEVNKLSSKHNVETVSLGQIILKAETAVINLLSIIMYEFEKNVK